MEPHIDVITLAVGDLDRSLAFYRDGLGLETRGVTATEFVDDETNAAGAIVIFHSPPKRSHPRALPAQRTRQGRRNSLRTTEDGRAEHRTPRREQSRGGCAAGPSRSSRRDPHGATPRSPVGDLLRLLPRPRRTSLGDHLEPAERKHRAMTVTSHRRSRARPRHNRPARSPAAARHRRIHTTGQALACGRGVRVSQDAAHVRFHGSSVDEAGCDLGVGEAFGCRSRRGSTCTRGGMLTG